MHLLEHKLPVVLLAAHQPHVAKRSLPHTLYLLIFILPSIKIHTPSTHTDPLSWLEIDSTRETCRRVSPERIGTDTNRWGDGRRDAEPESLGSSIWRSYHVGWIWDAVQTVPRHVCSTSAEVGFDLQKNRSHPHGPWPPTTAPPGEPSRLRAASLQTRRRQMSPRGRAAALGSTVVKSRAASMGCRHQSAVVQREALCRQKPARCVPTHR